MARGPGGYRNTSGLKPWKRGQSGNPRGRPPDYLSFTMKQALRDKVVRYGNEIMQSDLEQIKRFVKAGKGPALQLLIAKAFLRVIETGNIFTLNMLLNHIVGKPQDSYVLSDE